MKTKIIFRSALLIAITMSLFNFLEASASFTVMEPPFHGGKYDFVLDPGKTASDEIWIRNDNPTSSDFTLYGADSSNSSDGSFALTSVPNDEQRTVGVWVTFPEKEVTVQAGETKKCKFNIKLPDKIKPGTYLGGIAVEKFSSKASGTGSGVNVIARYASRLYVTVPGEVVHKPVFENFSHQRVKDTHKFNIGMLNAGNTHIKAIGKIEISGFPFGNSPENDEFIKTCDDPQLKAYLIKERNLNIIDIGKIEVASEDTGTYDYVWKRQPFFGYYKAKADITFYEYETKSGKDINPQTISKEIEFIVIPWLIIYAIIAFIILMIAIIAYRHEKITHMKRFSEKHTVGDRETITGLAKQYGIKWKVLAKINNLQAPYILTPGDQIIVPLAKGKKPNNNIPAPTPVQPAQQPQSVYPAQSQQIQPGRQTTPPPANPPAPAQNPPEQNNHPNNQTNK